MTVTTITYRRLVSIGNYENISLEMSADLDSADQRFESLDMLARTLHTGLARILGPDDEWRLRTFNPDHEHLAAKPGPQADEDDDISL